MTIATDTGSRAGSPDTPISAGSDLRAAFRAAYENRYTWDDGFSGYGGSCGWSEGSRSIDGGQFSVTKDLRIGVDGFDDDEVVKAIKAQLWEVTIHRVRRSFEQTHGENTFTAGETDATGMEVIVGGKCAGDRYRIKDDVVTMVHRHIHGTLVKIHTESTIDTGSGYLSKAYTSRYYDPVSGNPRGAENHFTDTFACLSNGYWTLAQRLIRCGDNTQIFRFEKLAPLA
ncbi:MAG: DUF3386 domain-containing protein [Aphanocapsa feldmannii 288cV]|nr:MAG: DUF3386 domain-containing protein [Aphanocapsa feldmannii 288cV]